MNKSFLSKNIHIKFGILFKYQNWINSANPRNHSYFFQINIEPLYISVTSSHVIVASRDAFYVWHFRTAQSWTTLRLDSSNKTPAQNANSKSSERLYHVDDAPGGMYSFFPVKFFTKPKICSKNLNSPPFSSGSLWPY